MKEYGEMQFMASSPPAADAGEYRVKVHQNVTNPWADSYTHLTLPTSDLVSISEDGVQIKKRYSGILYRYDDA